jgi:glycosyltransferase involved in cell wall biosynthesis
MTQTHPVSVIIPAYNAEAFLEETLQSIHQQTVQPAEIIVIDDGSTDRTAEIVQQFPHDIRYVYQNNQGQEAAAEHGIRLATSDYVAFLDADDLWVPDKLEKQLKLLEEHPGTQIILGHLQRFWVDAEGKKHFLEPEFAMSFISALIHKPLFDRERIAVEALKRSYDIDWFLRAREQNIATHIHRNTVAFYRRHGNQMTSQATDEDNKAELLRLLRRSIDRRRQNNQDQS